MRLLTLKLFKWRHWKLPPQKAFNAQNNFMHAMQISENLQNSDLELLASTSCTIACLSFFWKSTFHVSMENSKSARKAVCGTKATWKQKPSLLYHNQLRLKSVFEEIYAFCVFQTLFWIYGSRVFVSLLTLWFVSIFDVTIKLENSSFESELYKEIFFVFAMFSESLQSAQFAIWSINLVVMSG